MGSWGAGIFENDTALDYLGNLVQRLKRDLEEDVSSLHDGVLERPAGVIVAILRCLAGCSSSAASIVDARDVKRWREAYLSWLKEVELSESFGRDHWKQYSEVLSKEFDDLSRKIEGT